jgi:two-component system response regulator FixJ
MFEPGLLEGAPLSGPHPIYVVDDEPGIRMSLVHALESDGHVVWSFSSGPDLLAVLDTVPPGCQLLDIAMPEMDGLAVMAELTARRCDWPVIVMTAHGDIPTAVAAMKLGAMEFIEKPFGRNVLPDAIARALAHLALSDIRRADRRAARALLARLTPKEMLVLRALMTGDPNKVIAHRLGLSVRTVEMHRANLLAKLEMRSVQQAAAQLSGMLDEMPLHHLSISPRA